MIFQTLSDIYIFYVVPNDAMPVDYLLNVSCYGHLLLSVLSVMSIGHDITRNSVGDGLPYTSLLFVTDFKLKMSRDQQTLIFSLQKPPNRCILLAY